MRMEPDTDREALTRRLHQQYNIDIENLTLVHKGFVGYCYIVDCANSDRYFLKLYDDSRLGRINASRLDFYLPLTWNLHHKGILPNVPYPIKTRNGHLKTDFEGQPLVLFNFIDGKMVGWEDPLPDHILMKLASMVGIFHRSTPEIGIEFDYVEDFGIPFEDDMINGLNALENTTSRDSWGKQELRKLLLPRRDEILGYLDRLKELQKVARIIEKDKVLCHTDLHGGNLIINDQGDLYILDWEGAMIAPPEHDLFFCAWEDRFVDLFLPNYQREFGPAELDSNVFGFYYYRRNLEDLTDWIVRILYENVDDEQDRNDLDGIVEDCVSGWPYLEDTISKIDAKLRQIRKTQIA